MEINGYKPRIIDSILREELDAMGAVLIEGSKACGKTTTGLNVAESVIYIDDPVKRSQYLQLADTDISAILKGANPRLIDEWQLAPKIWDAVRYEVDRRGKDGQFILTGSAVPPKDKLNEITHSGAGRFAWLRMRPMSLWESGESSGDVSLKQLFSENYKIDGYSSDSDLDGIAFLTCRGGWPKAVAKGKEKSALRQVSNYYEAIVRSDISRVDNVARDEIRTRRTIRALARHIGTQSTITTLLKDLKINDSSDMSDKTLYSYINALKKMFVLEYMTAWNPNLRSKTAVRAAETGYFVDPSIGCAALGLGPDDLINDLKSFGYLFENLCVRDLRVYAQPLYGTVYHYRDRNGLECD
ncbi:MAG: ATP-binding protein, partial [Muribaculaceae bacterium]|nr:ATP-binding protein [Muribaculaceae bacterium]